MIEAKITAIAPWFGGKRNLAATIVEELGPHLQYFEPFCGSCAVLFAKDQSRYEVVNDLHGDLTNLASVLASDDWQDLYQRVGRTLYCEGLFNECRRRFIKNKTPLPDSPSVDRAWEFLVVSWIGRNGVAGTMRQNYQFTLRYTSGGGDSSTRWRGVEQSIQAWHQRLNSVVISRKCGMELLAKVPDETSTAIYCDPPYIVKGAAYMHDFDMNDHSRMAIALSRFQKSRIVVSYYDHPALKDLYSGWTKRNLVALKQLATQNTRGSKKELAPEVLLLNGPSFAKEKTKTLF